MRHDVYIEGDDARIGCERCGIHFHVGVSAFAKNVARMSPSTYICRDCRHAIRSQANW